MYSTNGSELKQLLETSYGLTHLAVNLIRVGGDGNQTYRVTAGESSLIARIYGEFNSIGNTDHLCFFDFSNAGIGWRVYDLSVFLWPLRDDTIHEPKIRAAFDEFMEGYRKVRPLLPEEETAVAASVKARDFWEAGCWLEFGVNLDSNKVRTSMHAMADQFRGYPISHNRVDSVFFRATAQCGTTATFKWFAAHSTA